MDSEVIDNSVILLKYHSHKGEHEPPMRTVQWTHRLRTDYIQTGQYAFHWSKSAYQRQVVQLYRQHGSGAALRASYTSLCRDRCWERFSSSLSLETVDRSGCSDTASVV
ncbi:hypothetical protein J6590_032653 [Homalodisca vitripennis]|nr:hypothetical protein J6590_032653 [Homalodisca vitripennis]